MAEAAALEYEPRIDITEEYARSLSTIYRLGRAAVEPCMAPGEYEATRTLAFHDFSTAVTEMLTTDPDFREELDLENTRTHSVFGGHVRSAEGVPMVDIVTEGAKLSAEMASENPAFAAQAKRDASDKTLAEKVDRLRPGQTLWGVSMAPRQALHDHKDTYTRLGYRSDLAYLQAYCRVDEDTLATSSYSVEIDDEDVFRKVLAARGVAIPEAASDNTWLDYTSEEELDDDQTRELLETVRHEYYEAEGKSSIRQSVTKFVEQNTATVRNSFNAYYQPLSEAVYKQQNNHTLKEFATTVLDTGVTELKPEVRHQLICVANKDSFDDQAAKTIDSVLRYAVVEELRKGLPAFLENPETHHGVASLPMLPEVTEAGSVYPLQDIGHLHVMLSNNVQQGVAAGRSYGGCAGNIELTQQTHIGQLDDNGMGSLQEAYGGNKVTSLDDDKYGSRKFDCPKCKHTNTRPRGKLIPNCQSCGADVRC